MSGPIDFFPACCRYQAMLASDAAEEADARPRERDLGGGGEHQRPVLVARGGGQPQHVDLLHRVVGEGVHGVGVVPEQPEIGCGRAHLHQPSHLFPCERDAGRVGEHRHAPHPLDGRVGGDELLDQVDVGSVLEHRHVDHLDAQALGDGEVPVVAGHRAQELDDGIVAPRPRRIHPAVQQREHHHVVHQLEARVVTGDQVLHRDAEQLAEDGAQFGQAVQAAVVAGVGALPVAVGILSGSRQVQ